MGMANLVNTTFKVRTTATVFQAGKGKPGLCFSLVLPGTVDTVAFSRLWSYAAGKRPHDD